MKNKLKVYISDDHYKYKPFSRQFRECKKIGNAFIEKCHICGHELLMCKQYGGQCISNKCKDNRIRKGHTRKVR